MVPHQDHPLGCVERRSDRQAIGMCGLLQRDSLNEVDLGFAFPPAAHVLDAVGLHFERLLPSSATVMLLLLFAIHANP